ncbi:DHA2 family efflux MFS transporter permease subunit [Paraconexibacter algicola]|uniref:MFS transporter n=1 Tax=Paraconexibacter algicola TaxID=2133960 RepID=A0A2T4UKY4_9ACTN|nr:DHA2 family efflux MFS transporter permease subunit [Paraconexibacter algicola]PTL59912.1 MFS transporter [Paraconexibacter algicola]
MHATPVVDAAAKRWALIACILGSAVVFVDSTVVNVALPALQEDLDASLAGQQWVVESYLLTLSALILTGGSLGDLFGRRRVFALGIGGFGVTSVLCAIAPTVETLVAARALQGVAGALLVPSTLAILTEIHPDPHERGAAIGSWTAWTSGAIALGPPLGGLLVDAVSWRLIFAINVPVVAVTLWLTLRHVPALAPRTTDGRHVDVVGSALAALGLGGVVLGMIEQPVHGWGDPLVWAPLGLGVALLAGFVAYERRTPNPMLPLSLFAERGFAAANATTLTVYAGLGAATFFVALFLQQVAGYDAVEGGLALTPVTLMMVTLSRRWGALAERVGARLLMTAGPAIMAVGMLLYLRVDERGDYLADVLPAVLVFGLGLSMTVAPLTAAVLGAVDDRHAGVASGVNNAIARVAGLLAIAGVGAVVSGRLGAATFGDAAPADALDAFHAGMVVSAALLVLGALTALLALRPGAAAR